VVIRTQPPFGDDRDVEDELADGQDHGANPSGGLMGTFALECRLRAAGKRAFTLECGLPGGWGPAADQEAAVLHQAASVDRDGGAAGEGVDVRGARPVGPRLVAVRVAECDVHARELLVL